MDDTLTGQNPFPAVADTRPVWGLAVAWSADEAHRAGEVVLLPEGTTEVGRGSGPSAWQLGGGARPTGPLAGRRLSRRQLHLTSSAASLAVRNVGKAEMSVGGRTTASATVREGDVISLLHAAVFVVVRRVPVPSGERVHTFGQPDASGMVGESAALWALRDDLAFIGARPGHVLLHGPSGSGKELAAAALHAHTGRRGALLARNMATIPEGLASAELFGHRAGYPHAGMSDHPGLVGDAHDGTLFLDEVGEVPEAVQAQLLRFLDAGEYQRLGETTTRRSDARVVAATHRNPDTLKHDLLARFRHRVVLSGLDQRPDDVVLTAQHLLRTAATADPTLDRFFDGGVPRLSQDLVLALLAHHWTTHVRELDRFLWEAIREARGDHLDRPVGLAPPKAIAIVQPSELDRDALIAGLEACDGVVSRAWQHLGLSSRDQLRRLMRKHDIGG